MKSKEELIENIKKELLNLINGKYLGEILDNITRDRILTDIKASFDNNLYYDIKCLDYKWDDNLASFTFIIELKPKKS